MQNGRTLLATGLLASALLCPLAFAEEGPACRDDQEHYLAGNQCIYLTRSATAKAFELASSTAFTEFERRARESGATVERLGARPGAPEFVVLRQPPEARACGFCDASFTAATERLASERPIYTIPNGELIMHGESIVYLADREQVDEVIGHVHSIGGQVIPENPPVDYRLTVRFPGLSPEEALDQVNRLHRHVSVRFAEPVFTQLTRRIQPEPVDLPSPERESEPEGDSIAAEDPCSLMSNDPYGGYQWALCNDGSGDNILDADIDAPEAWEQTACSDTVIVAVLDDGVDTLHPQLHDRIVKSYDATLTPSVPNPNKLDYHGTAVAGIIGARTDDGSHTAGVCGKVLIMPVRIGFTTSASSHWQTKAKDIDRAIRWAADNGASILNGSWTAAPSDSIEAAIEYAAVEKGLLLIFAAGNLGMDVQFPANLTETANNKDVRDRIIAVSATDGQDKLMSASNRGSAITIAAPGDEILTTDIVGLPGYYTEDLAWFSETSAAAPHVAGVAALVFAARPDADAAEVKTWLQDGADDLGNPQLYGSGRLNALGALEAVP